MDPEVLKLTGEVVAAIYKGDSRAAKEAARLAAVRQAAKTYLKKD
jgi:hypothetical protein